MLETLDRAAPGAGSNALGGDPRPGRAAADGAGGALRLLRPYRADEGESPTRRGDDARSCRPARGHRCTLPQVGPRAARRGLGGSRRREKAPACDARSGDRFPYLALARTRKRLEQGRSRGDYGWGGAIVRLKPRNFVAGEHSIFKNPLYKPFERGRSNASNAYCVDEGRRRSSF